MNSKEKTDPGMDELIKMWMESTTSAFEAMKNMSPDDTGIPNFFGTSEKSSFKKSEKMFRSGGKILQSLISTLSKPENLDTYLKGTEVFPEFMINMNQQLWGGYFELQRQWMDRAARFGKHTEAYQFEDLDQEAFKVVRDIYTKEFQKFLQVPPLGLNRFPQERLQNFMDHLNQVQITLSEFIYMFYVPIEKSLSVMQEKAEAMIESGQIGDDFKSYYNIWIRTLEGHYMTLLKSPEYTEVPNNEHK